jgi:hypothetical protein
MATSRDHQETLSDLTTLLRQIQFKADALLVQIQKGSDLLEKATKDIDDLTRRLAEVQRNR